MEIGGETMRRMKFRHILLVQDFVAFGLRIYILYINLNCLM